MTTDRPPRETRIDIVRGAAMLIIAINHITVAFRIYGLQGFGIPTPSALGYSSSAAIFVIMSGYMVGMVYQKKPRPAQAVLRRARTLYIDNALLLVAVAPFLLLMEGWEAVAWDAGFLFDDPLAGLLLFVTLLRAPALLDVLQLYVIFMLLTPAALWVYRRSPPALAALSVTLWLLSQLATATHLVDPKLVEWKFNPLAWQLVFFVPLILGAARVHEPLFRLLEARKWITVVVGGAAAGFAIAKLLHVEQAIPQHWLLTSKGNLGVLRLVHAPVVILFYCGLLTLSRRIPELSPMRALACVGRQTLYCYIASVWLTYGLAIAWSRLGGGYLAYLAAVLFSLLATFAIAVLYDARSGRQAARMRETMPREDDRRGPVSVGGVQ
ncbi:OpgC domain-containing protein [Sphingomonas melonis]|uniref:Acyltransferase 3 domain-containing protein n=1 Tax=Sphingomonas melonis TaxID=152682 RepID=A0A7Y9FR70_9SPHN|nr:OpgC domain-containing protein [Sphingomonas melonis]NYD91975.1 hypothetical protein [Sphingomonas melonis]